MQTRISLGGHPQVFRGQHDLSSSGFTNSTCSDEHNGSSGQLQPEITHNIMKGLIFSVVNLCFGADADVAKNFVLSSNGVMAPLKII